jgi:hypothetical protein
VDRVRNVFLVVVVFVVFFVSVGGVVGGGGNCGIIVSGESAGRGSSRGDGSRCGGRGG